jgi:hypothetical protein
LSTPYTGAAVKTQYVEEVTYGQTPTNPTFLWIGIIQNVEPSYDRGLIKLPGIGTRDLTYILKGLAQYGVALQYAYQNKTFLHFVKDLNDFSLETWFEKGSLINSYLNKGAMINALTVSASVNEPVTVKPDIILQDVAISTNHPSGATYANDPGTVPKTWYDTQATLDAAVIDALTDWHFTVNNNLQRFPVIRSSSGDLLKFLIERQRQLSGELTVAYMDSALLAKVAGATEFTLVFTVGSDTFTFNNCKFDAGRFAAKPVEVVPQRLPWTAKTLTIT